MVNNMHDLINLLNNLKQNPVSTLAGYKYNIPQGMTDPSQIMQHLLNTGQVNQAQINNAASQGNSPIIRKMFGL